MKCPNCKTPLEKGDVFCPVCGSRVEKKTTVPTILLVSLSVLLIAGGIGVWLFAGKEDLSEKTDKEEKIVQKVERSKEKQEIESDHSVERKYDIDCTGGQKVTMLGTVLQEDTGYYLKFSEGTQDLLVENKDGKEEIKKELDKILLQSENSLIPYNGRMIQVDGQVKSEGDPLVLQAESLTYEDDYDDTEGGIHRYEFIISDCTWEQAYQECLKRGGYLVRINSRREYDYILNQIAKKNMKEIQFKLGGRRDMDSHDYYWINEQNQLYGEKINSSDYWCTNEWMRNEPSYQDRDVQENCLDIFYYEDEGRWVWNDIPNNVLQNVSYFSGKIGYICEYED